ncbi:phosphotransferase family protein [Achromobacter sp. GG226]|uniref:phosphotransferase family protein n=1 Tax=Verticiella alkaliphila TaxID=2779529 RepID=UPI001C0AD431|nr:phosphotransferase family protein [Verticiella sp. GG226]MBU4609919.1 phosphotransferase family protein [Verticiella sp. GG226]
MYEEFIGTQPVRQSHQFDVAALDAWLTANVADYAGPLEVTQFKGGQSNPTYRLVTPGRRYVMRSKPGPVSKLLPSAHAIEREYRLMAALHDTDVPVPRMYALCEDESVIGRAFYIMECMEGRVLWDQSLPGMTPAERGAIYDEMNRVIAALHQVDYAGVGLGDYGRPGSYFERQISRWSKQYRASETQSIPEMDKVIEWLPGNIPPDDGSTSIVHGDYRLDNVMFHPTEPRIIAVLDWELSTIGHPLADFCYHLMAWHTPADKFRGVGGLDLPTLGIPTAEQYVARYCERTGRDGIANLDFYLAYNMFRIAGILQGIAKRVQDGTASSDRAAASAQGARPMAELAWAYAQRAGARG